MARYAIPVAAPASTDRTSRLFRVQIGATLQKHRRLKGLTQAQVADRAALSLKYVGEVERGDANVSIDIIARIADVIGLNQEDLMHPLVDQTIDIQQRPGAIVIVVTGVAHSTPKALSRSKLLPPSNAAPDVYPSRRGRRAKVGQ